MEKRRSFPISYLFPNIITLAGLCLGLSAMRLAMVGHWKMAVVFLIIAAIVDGMDGRLARMLNATSTFGAQLDSLADFVSFGVAPVVVLYLWQLQHVKGLGWIVVLFFAVCMALRLARFNSRIFEATPKQKELANIFFTGVPAPAGAMLSLVPLVLSFEFGKGFYTDPRFCLAYISLLALLLVSTIPTFSAKKFKIRSHHAVMIMVVSGLWIAGWIIEPWITYALTAALYFAMIPVSVARYHRLQAEMQTTSKEDGAWNNG